MARRRRSPLQIARSSVRKTEREWRKRGARLIRSAANEQKKIRTEFEKQARDNARRTAELHRRQNAQLAATQKADKARLKKQQKKERERNKERTAQQRQRLNEKNIARRQKIKGLKKEARTAEVQGRRSANLFERITGISRKPTAQRTPYEKRVARNLARQAEQNEPISLSRAGGHKPRRSAAPDTEIKPDTGVMTDEQAFAALYRRLRLLFPNSENYSNSFLGLQNDPGAVRALLELSNYQIWELILANSKENSGERFYEKLQELTGYDGPIVFGTNPLFYHSRSHMFGE